VAETRIGPGPIGTEKIVASKTEAEIYSKLGLAFIEPELREGLGRLVLLDQRFLRSPCGRLLGSRPQHHSHVNDRVAKQRKFARTTMLVPLRRLMTRLSLAC
jgi:hypothetical protein